MGEDPLLERSQLGARFQPELVIQRLAASAIHIKRVGVAPASVQSEHQLSQQPLPVGVQSHESLELANQPAVMTEHEVGVDTVLKRGQPRFLQARNLALSERLVRQISERVPAPQGQRGAQQLTGAGSLTVGERVTPVRDQGLEALGVHLTRRGRKQITAGTRQEHVGAERLTQVRHVPLQRFRCRCRRSLAPQLIDQAIARERLPAAQQQDREQRPLARAAEHNRPFLLDHLKRPQDAELKHDLVARGQPYYRATGRPSAARDPPPTDLPPPPTARLPASGTVC